MTCHLLASGVVELYFYGELEANEHARVDEHLSRCGECRSALEDLRTIRDALASRPDVAAPAAGDWTPFMARLDAAIRREQIAAASPADPVSTPLVASASPRTVHASYVGYIAMAALLALVTMSVLLAWRTRDRDDQRSAAAPVEAGAAPADAAPRASAAAAETPRADPAFVSLSEEHFERSKLVVLGLATKDPSDAESADWEYERTLAGALLKDTRLYRLAAEERGLASLAHVMEDLELVLLQASMSDKPDASSLEQLQRLIRKRDLVTKMGVVTTATTGI